MCSLGSKTKHLPPSSSLLSPPSSSILLDSTQHHIRNTTPRQDDCVPVSSCVEKVEVKNRLHVAICAHSLPRVEKSHCEGLSMRSTLSYKHLFILPIDPTTCYTTARRARVSLKTDEYVEVLKRLVSPPRPTTLPQVAKFLSKDEACARPSRRLPSPSPPSPLPRPRSLRHYTTARQVHASLKTDEYVEVMTGSTTLSPVGKFLSKYEASGWP